MLHLHRENVSLLSFPDIEFHLTSRFICGTASRAVQRTVRCAIPEHTYPSWAERLEIYDAGILGLPIHTILVHNFQAQNNTQQPS
jgi:hypothetical protein